MFKLGLAFFVFMGSSISAAAEPYGIELKCTGWRTHVEAAKSWVVNHGNIDEWLIVSDNAETSRIYLDPLYAAPTSAQLIEQSLFGLPPERLTIEVNGVKVERDVPSSMEILMAMASPGRSLHYSGDDCGFADLKRDVLKRQYLSAWHAAPLDAHLPVSFFNMAPEPQNSESFAVALAVSAMLNFYKDVGDVGRQAQAAQLLEGILPELHSVLKPELASKESMIPGEWFYATRAPHEPMELIFYAGKGQFTNYVSQGPLKLQELSIDPQRWSVTLP